MREMLTTHTDVRIVCLCVCEVAEIGGGACRVCRAVCGGGRSVQPSPNAFGFLFLYKRGTSDEGNTESAIIFAIGNMVFPG